MKEKIPYYLSVFILTLATFMLLSLGWLQLVPLDIVELKESPIRVDKKAYYPGDDVYIYLNYDKKLDYKPDSVEYFLTCDGAILMLTNIGVNRPVGERETRVRKTIPSEIMPNICMIYIELNYKVTPFRDIFYRWETERFEVLEATQSAR